MSEHLRPDDAAGIACLAADDPQRRAAVAHAATCAECRAALDSAAQLMAFLDAVPAPPPPSAQVLARVAGAVHEAQRRPRLALGVAASAVFAWGLILFLASQRLPSAGAWIASTGAAILAGLGAAGAIAWGGQSIALIAGASALYAVVSGGIGGVLAPGPGMHCVAMELLAAAIVLVPVGVLTFRRSSAATLFTAAAAGALAGHAALGLTCPANAELPHLLAFHVGPVLVLAGLAALAWRFAGRGLVARSTSAP